jgi:hypothetical protein
MIAHHKSIMKNKEAAPNLFRGSCAAYNRRFTRTSVMYTRGPELPANLQAHQINSLLEAE